MKINKEIKLLFFICIILFTLLISGCDNRQKYIDEIKAMGYEFSLDNFTLKCRDGDTAVVEKYIKAGVGNTRNSIDWINHGLVYAAGAGKIDIVHILINEGAFIDFSSHMKGSNTALILAVAYNHPETIEFLLEKGADLNTPNSNGETALMIAAENGARESLILLLNKNALINMKDNNRMTALVHAARGNRLEFVTLLWESGASKSATKDELNEVYYFAELNDNWEILSYLQLEYMKKEYEFFFTRQNMHKPFPIASSSYPADNWGTYSPNNIIDGTITTSWVEGVDGHGIGERIAFHVPRSVHSIRIFPGYGNEKIFKTNSRLKKAKVTFCYISYEWYDGDEASLQLQKNAIGSKKAALYMLKEVASMELAFSDKMKFQEFDIPITLYPSRHYSHVLGILEILDVYKGKDPDTCIAEIEFIIPDIPDPSGKRCEYVITWASGGYFEYSFYDNKKVEYKTNEPDRSVLKTGTWKFASPLVKIHWYNISGEEGKGELLHAFGNRNEWEYYEAYSDSINEDEEFNWSKAYNERGVGDGENECYPCIYSLATGIKIN